MTEKFVSEERFVSREERILEKAGERTLGLLAPAANFNNISEDELKKMTVENDPWGNESGDKFNPSKEKFEEMVRLATLPGLARAIHTCENMTKRLVCDATFPDSNDDLWIVAPKVWLTEVKREMLIDVFAERLGIDRDDTDRLSEMAILYYESLYKEEE